MTKEVAEEHEWISHETSLTAHKAYIGLVFHVLN